MTAWQRTAARIAGALKGAGCEVTLADTEDLGWRSRLDGAAAAAAPRWELELAGTPAGG